MKIQAKHIPDEAILELIDLLQKKTYLYVDFNVLQLSRSGTATIWDIFALWPSIPEKVIRAKLKRLIKRGLIDGCVCGCRGDFTLNFFWIGGSIEES